jgi:hypothetical protein
MMTNLVVYMEWLQRQATTLYRLSMCNAIFIL